MPDSNPFIACPDCDLLQREVFLAPGCVARCSRCGAVLYRNATDSINRTLALSLASAIAFLAANLYPVLGVVVWGDSRMMTLFEAIGSAWHLHRPFIACIVFITAILVPDAAPYILRILQRVRPWGMVEVFMLGVLVSVVKLRDNFTVIPGIALWSFAALTLLFTATAATFNPRDVWARLERENLFERKR